MSRSAKLRCSDPALLFGLAAVMGPTSLICRIERSASNLSNHPDPDASLIFAYNESPRTRVCALGSVLDKLKASLHPSPMRPLCVPVN